MIEIIIFGLFVYGLFRLQLFLYRKNWDKNLKVTVKFEAGELFEGDSSRLLEIIENRKKLPLNMVNVKFQTDRYLLFDDEKGTSVTDKFYRNDIFQIRGFEKITRRLPFVAGKRGYYQVNYADLVGSDIFLSKQFYSSTKTDTAVYVYPKPFKSKEMQLSLQQLNGEMISKRHLIEDPFEYRGIREYLPFDDMRTINWKATARTGELKVNQKGETTVKEVRIFINTEDTGVLKKDDCVEACFRIAAGICKEMNRQGMRFSLYSNGLDIMTGRPIAVNSNSGEAHLYNVYRNLARIDTEKTGKGFVDLFAERVMDRNSSILTVFISPNQYDDFVELVEHYSATGNGFVWYLPVWEQADPKVSDKLRSNMRIIHIR